MAPPCWLVITRPAWRSWFNASADRLAAIADRAAEDNKAIFDQPIHECRVLIPRVLVPDLTRGVPPRAVDQPYREIGHGRRVLVASDTRPPPSARGRQSERAHAADRVLLVQGARSMTRPSQ